MKRLLIKYLSIILFLCNAVSLFGQVDREFWFAIPKENDNHGSITTANDVSLKIVAQALPANVTISMPLNGTFATINQFVPAGATRIVVLATSFAQFGQIYANPGLLDGIPLEGITNRGLHIVSDNDITVYYDYNNYYNRDLWALKGKNGLGTEFYAPFQYLYANGSGYKSAGNVPIAYSDINIVATVNNTVVTITPSVASQGHAAGVPFTVNLNAGQTYTLVAKAQTAASKLVGTHITSTQPISVSTNDDSEPIPPGTCYDINGDQLVPVSVIGSQYLVMCGTSSQLGTGPAAAVQDPTRAEQVFVVATKPNTTVTYQNRAGTVMRTSPVLAAGGKDYLSPNISDLLQDAIYISANNPIYVYHITGIGCETGGAILPPITNCTGSQSVSFYRAADLNDLTLNLMIPYDTSIPFSAASQSYNFFTVTYQNGTTVSIPGSWFEPVPNAGWAVLIGGAGGPRYFNNTNTFIPKGQAVKIENTKDFFHLGITNGTSGQTDKYGYFSSFNAVQASARVAQTEYPTYLSCFGDTVNLQAYGGISYQWHYGSATSPLTTYLSDPKSATPQVFCPPGIHYFYVTVHRPTCFGDVTLPITVTVLPEVKASFEADPTAACSPVSAQFTNTSKGANKYEWSLKIDNGTENIFVPSSPISFTQSPLDNKTSPYVPKQYVYKLKASRSGACKDSAKKTITVYPEIKASILPIDTIGCAPLLVHFRNNSSGNVTDSSYYWNFGDENTSIIKVPSHLYNNYFTIKDTTYKAMLVTTSPYLCRDTARANIAVHPFIKAGFTVDTVKGCSPFFIKIYNNSQNRKAISKYFWDFNYKNPAAAIRDTLTTGDKDTIYHSYPRNLTNAPIVYKILLTVNHKYGTGCPDTISRAITVYPEGKVSILNPDTIGCNALTVKFRKQADPGVIQYIWDFDDGSTSNDSIPTHQFINLTNTDKVYKVNVRTLSAQYCGGFDTMRVTVHANLDPLFSLDVPKTCAPYIATITNKTLGGITSYQWDFGDGTPWGASGAPSFTHLYSNTSNAPITYTAKLIVQNSGGCKDSTSQNITLYPQVQSQFSTTMGAWCSPRKVDFVNQSNAVATKFIWRFGDNATSLSRDTTHYYENRTTHDTIYYATLIAISDDGCKDTSMQTQVLVYPYIEAYFALDTTAGCNPLDVRIINGSLGPYTSESWDFNNGLPASPAQPKAFSHVFYNSNTSSNKNYVISLRLTYKGTCLKTYFKSVMVYAPVIPKVSANMTTVCNNSEITFRDSTNRPPIPYSYKWEFGDNASSVGIYGANRSLPVITKHQYENFQSVYKSLNVKFSSYSQVGCSGDTSINIVVFPEVKASFSFEDPAGCTPFIVPLKNGSTSTATWVRFWDDLTTPSAGYPVNSLPATHTFLNDVDSVTKTYRPKLKVAYVYNGAPVCPDSITRTLNVYPKVTAYFAAKDSFKICHPDTVSFANGSKMGIYSLLQNDKKLTYKWTFGDNGSSSDYDPTHLYYNYSNDTPLFDTVRLTATSKYGCLNSIRKLVTIYPKPKAVFDVENSIACPPFKVRIDHSSVAEANSQFNWYFNDGGSDTITRAPVETLYHLFNNGVTGTATYPVQLVINTSHNCTSSTSQDINVYPRVMADFDKDAAGCNPFIVAFKDKSKQADSWYWDFGDNLSSKTQSPQHTFFNYSINDTTYTVKLRATSKFLCYHDTTREITVYPQPIANFDADRYYFTYSPTNNIVTFTNQTNVGNWNYAWNFDDQTPIVNSMGPVLQHDYQPHWDGRYNVQLKVWSPNCIDSITHRITIIAPKPIADFSMSENGCVPLTVSFTELTDYGTKWVWEFGDGGTYDGLNPPPYVFHKAGKYNVKLTVTGNGGTSYVFKDVEVFPKPKVNFDLKPHLVMLSEKMEAPVQFYNKCELGTRFLWDFGDSTKSQELAPLHIYKSIGTYTVKLGAWTVNQCYDEIIKKDTVEVIAQHVLLFPNAFTPSLSGQNDGSYSVPDTKNEVFHPSWTGIVEYHLEIYDRWGEKLFESDDVNKGWNGYYKGKLCKTDVYIWKAKGKYTDGSTFEKAGNVTLLR